MAIRYAAAFSHDGPTKRTDSHVPRQRVGKLMHAAVAERDTTVLQRNREAVGASKPGELRRVCRRRTCKKEAVFGSGLIAAEISAFFCRRDRQIAARLINGSNRECRSATYGLVKRRLWADFTLPPFPRSHTCAHASASEPPGTGRGLGNSQTPPSLQRRIGIPEGGGRHGGSAWFYCRRGCR